MGPASMPLSIDIRGDSDDDDFGMELERGGSLVSQVPSMSAPPSSRSTGPASSGAGAIPSGRPPASGASGLDVAHRRLEARPAVVDKGPSTGQKLLAWLVPTLSFIATAAPLTLSAHKSGGRNFMNLLPHAFDATSTVQSGAVSLGALVLAIAVGFIGLKLHPRSYAMLGAGTMLLLASLAMVTVTLVSSEEHPTPPDGALLIPYVVPLAIVLLGFGLAARGPRLFLQGGSRRAIAAIAGLAGGALVFVALETSTLASRLP